MAQPSQSIRFESPLGKYIERMIAEERTKGYRYDANERALLRLDRFLVQSGLNEVRLSKELAQAWMKKRPNERPATQLKRIYGLARLARYLDAHDVESYVPDLRLLPSFVNDFRPRILTREEIRHLLTVADSLPYNPRSPMRHVIMPLLFRVLYSCGLRISEALKLRIKDVDRSKGVFTIYQAKFDKDRLIPLSPGLHERIERYFLIHRADADREDLLFPSPWGGHYDPTTVRRTWLNLLWESGIPYEGKGKGPRIHDLRHTYAVHRLATWHAAGEDLSLLLPVLSVYMGHTGMQGTQHYLRLSAEMYPEVSGRLETDHGHVIPRRAGS